MRSRYARSSVVAQADGEDHGVHAANRVQHVRERVDAAGTRAGVVFVASVGHHDHDPTALDPLEPLETLDSASYSAVPP